MNQMDVNLGKILDDAELSVMAGSLDTEVGKIVFKVVTCMRDKGREAKPRIDDDDLRKDFRAVIGEINVCNLILDLPRAARSIMTKGEKK